MSPSDAVPPQMYSLIKAHKPNKQYPMRPVVSTLNTAFHGTSSHLVSILNPILSKNDICVKNSTSFTSEARSWSVSPEEIQVSYDVIALYPSVPIDKAIRVIMDMVSQNFDEIRKISKLTTSDIHTLIELCLKKCYFLWDNTLFEVPDTGPIGLSLMVVIAEAYLQKIESIAIQQSLTLQCQPLSYRRYVDDSHSRFHSMEQANKFLDLLNKQDNNIQYTMEAENDKKELGYLDILIINNVHNKYILKSIEKMPSQMYNSNRTPV